MGACGRFLRRLEGGYAHWCPGCQEMHYIAVERPLANGAQWNFNGDIERPDFSPSVLIKWPRMEGKADLRCHYFIRHGHIQFCSDSTHEFAGKTVPLPEWPAGEEDW